VAQELLFPGCLEQHNIMSEQYYYVIEGKQQGPVSRTKLRELAEKGEVKRQDKIWCQGMAEWQPAATISQLFDGLPPDIDARPTHTTPPPLPTPLAAPAIVTSPVTTSAPTIKPRSPGLMALASFILPGLGQLICGQDAKGLFLIITSIVGNVLTVGLSSVAMCPLMSIDAYMIARKRNDAKVSTWEFFPTWANINKQAAHVVPSVLIAVVLLFWAVAKLEEKKEQDARLEQNQEKFLNILETARRERGY